MSVSAMTRSEMVLEVANCIGRDKNSLSADNSTTYETRIKTWLYWSHLTIARLYAFPELDTVAANYTLSTSTNVYTFTTLVLSRVRQILSVQLIDGTASQKVDRQLWRGFAQDYPNVDEDPAGKPDIYTIFGQRVEFNKLPDDDYTLKIRYNQYPDDFSGDSDTSDYTYKDDLIVAGAVVHAYVSLQELEDAKYWAGVFAGRLQTAIGLVSEPQDWEPEGRAFDMNGHRSIGDAHANPLVYFNP